MFFFFKQKTAYEMRISDWSSDVCSSDLRNRPRLVIQGCRSICPSIIRFPAISPRRLRRPARNQSLREVQLVLPQLPIMERPRSEEHTSELQSLMRISYAVFCLKKKIHDHTITKSI